MSQWRSAVLTVTKRSDLLKARTYKLRFRRLLFQYGRVPGKLLKHQTVEFSSCFTMRLVKFSSSVKMFCGKALRLSDGTLFFFAHVFSLSYSSPRRLHPSQLSSEVGPDRGFRKDLRSNHGNRLCRSNVLARPLDLPRLERFSGTVRPLLHAKVTDLGNFLHSF